MDDGTAWEVGYAYVKGKPVHGIRTDFGQAGATDHSIVNAMIEGSCLSVTRSVLDLCNALRKVLGKDLYVVQKLLRHSDGRMTARHSHLADETLPRASETAGSITQKAQDAGEATKGG